MGYIALGALCGAGAMYSQFYGNSSQIAKSAAVIGLSPGAFVGFVLYGIAKCSLGDQRRVLPQEISKVACVALLGVFAMLLLKGNV